MRAVTLLAEDVLSYDIGKIVNFQVGEGVCQGWDVISSMVISRAVAEGMRDGMNQNISDTSTAGHIDPRFVDYTTGNAYVFAIGCDHSHNAMVCGVTVVYSCDNMYYLCVLREPS